MNDYYIATKIIKYINDYQTWYTIISLSKNWRKASKDLMYCIKCSKCGAKGQKVWKHFVGQKFKLLCTNCIDNNKDYYKDYTPAIPMLPGSQDEFWWTSDIPIDWMNLWIILDSQP